MTDFRITFSKTGPLVFISHLDLTHTFVRAFNRAGVKLKYSEGFNPHPKLVFALPLSVGMAGENELCDVSLTTEMQPEEFKKIITPCFPQYIEIKEVSGVGEKFRNVKSASYTYVFEGNLNLAQKINEFLNNDRIIITKKSKSGEKEANIKPQIFDFDAKNIENNIVLTITADASPDGYLNPEYLIKALEKHEIIPQNTTTTCKSTRTRIFLK